MSPRCRLPSSTFSKTKVLPFQLLRCGPCSGLRATEIWPIEELAEKLGTTSEVVRKGAGYWVANGALRASFQGRSLVYEVSFGEEINPSGEGTCW